MGKPKEKSQSQKGKDVNKKESDTVKPKRQAKTKQKTSPGKILVITKPPTPCKKTLQLLLKHSF